MKRLMASIPGRRSRRAGKKVLAEELQPHQHASAAGGGYGPFSSPRPNLAAAHDTYDRFRFRVVDRLFQYREPAAGSRHCPAKRDRGEAGGGSATEPACGSDADREGHIECAGRSLGSGFGMVWGTCATTIRAQ